MAGLSPASQLMLPSAKNGVLGAVTDLGMGDDLRSQVESEVLERKKKALMAANPGMAAQYGVNGMGTGLNAGAGLATMALLGQGGFRG